MTSTVRRWFPASPIVTGSRVPLFCFPHGGGDVLAFRGWQESIDSRVEIVAAALPGRERRIAEPLIPSITGLADALTEPTMERATATFALFGHSMGALVALELAHRLTAAGRAPSLLVVSGSPSPGERRTATLSSALPDADFLDAMTNLGGVPHGLFDDPDMRELLLPILRNDYSACEEYRPDLPTPLDVPLLVLAGDADPLCPPAALEGWAELTTQTTTFQMFPGGHFYLLDNVPGILELIGAAVRRAADVHTD